VLRIFQSTTASAAKAYYTEALAREDYYAAGAEGLGRWHGRGAERLGLAGAGIAPEAFSRLCENRHPATGARLTPRTRDDRTVGYDVNFHAAKGISLLHALGGDARIRGAMEAAVLETMGLIERDAHTRVRLGDKSEDRPTGNLVWGAFTHLTARPVDGTPDPHLHAHCFVMNATFDPVEQRWKAGQFRPIVRDAPYYQAVFHTRLAARLKAMGYAIARTADGWDVAGVPSELKARFSHRTNAIEAAARRLGISDAAMKAALGARTRAKKAKSLSHDELLRTWRDRLSAADRGRLHAVLAGAGTTSPLPGDDVPTPGDTVPTAGDHVPGADRGVRRAGDDVPTAGDTVPVNGDTVPGAEHAPPVTADEALRHALEHVFARRSVETDRRLVAEALQYGVGDVQPEDLWRALETHPDILTRRDGEQRVVTTRAVLEEEKAVLGFTVEGRGACRPLGLGFGGRAGDRFAIGRVAAQEGVTLNDAQHAALEHLLGSRDRVMLLRGGAGTGKTTLLREAAAALAHAETPVVACAVTTDASRGVLREAGFETAETLEKLLTSPDLQRQARDGVIWVDEAGMVGTPSMKRLFDAAHAVNARVVLAGDTKQHPPVERGDAMGLIERRGGIRPAEVDRIVRQRGLYREAVAAITSGRLADGIDRLDQLGAIRERRGEDRHTELAERYVEAIEAGQSALVVSPTHAEGRGVTARIREQLQAAGRLDRDERTVTRLQDLQRTDAEKRDPHLYEAGQVVQFTRPTPGSPRHHLKPAPAGLKATVVGVDPERKLVTTRDAAGELRPLPLHTPDRFEVFRAEPLSLAAGDRIRITRNARTADGAHRLANGAMFTIKGFTEAGDIRLDNKGGWTVSRHAGHLNHGYCVTPQAAQGKSVDVCLAAMGSASMAASTLEQLYVIVSRGRQRVELLTDQRSALIEAVWRPAGRRPRP